ncbi:hypothetical protein Tco_0733417 [Tanacetum coccineum]
MRCGNSGDGGELGAGWLLVLVMEDELGADGSGAGDKRQPGLDRTLVRVMEIGAKKGMMTKRDGRIGLVQVGRRCYNLNYLREPCKVRE